MTTLTITNTFTAGTTIQAAQMNTNFSDITTWAAGNITNNNIGVAASISLSKLDLTAVALNLRSSGNNTWASGVTGDTVPRVTLRSEGGIQFGAGSASALDLLIKRNSSTQFALRNAADSAFTDLTMGALTLGTALTVANGGTGLATLTANNVMLGNGTSNVQFVAPGSSGNVLTSNGTTWTSAAAAAGKYAPSTKSAAFTATDSPSGTLFLVDCTSAVPVSFGASPADGTLYSFAITAGTGGLTLDPNASETVTYLGEATTTFLIADKYSGVCTIAAISGGWQVV